MPTTLPLHPARRAPLRPTALRGRCGALACAALLAGCQQYAAPRTDTPPALTAQPQTIEAGQSARLSWDAPLGSSLRMSGLTATPPGAVLVRPAQTTTYTLSGPAPSGAPISASVTVEVAPTEAMLARLRIGDQPTGARIASGFLGLALGAGALQPLPVAAAAGPAQAGYRQLLRNLQNYGGGALSVRGAPDCPVAEPLVRAPAAPRCMAAPGAENPLASAALLLDHAQQGRSGVSLPGGLWNTAGQAPAVAPQYYGMLFFAQFAGAQGQWLPTQLDSGARIKAWAVRDAHNQSVRVAVINQEPGTSGTVAVQLPTGLHQAVVTRLTTTAPLRLAGQTFDGSRDGRPMGTAYGEILAAGGDGQLLLAMGAASAALLTLTPLAAPAH